MTDIERALYNLSMRQGDRKAETRTRLLEAAAEMFASHGIAGASVDAIAERAGRTVGGLYGHFASKEELLFAVVDEWLADAATVVAAELELATTADERLAALWRAVSQESAHRWISVVFTTAVIIVAVVVLVQEEPAAWVYLSPLLPLALLLLSGLYLFVMPYLRRRGSGPPAVREA